MRVAIQVRPAPAGPELHRFAEGVRACGDDIVEFEPGRSPPRNAKVAACWGWRRGEQLRQFGHEVLVLERGYVGDRWHWTSAGWNGLNNRARFYFENDGGARWERHLKHLLQPWRAAPDDDYALLLGQVPTDTAVRHIRLERWLLQTANLVRRRGERVLFRPHPNAPSVHISGVELSQGTLAEALSGARVAITFNSNAGVDAVLAGVPTYALDPGSMAYEVASHDLNEPPPRADRAPWAHRIAWSQWLPEELQSGEAWARLRSLFVDPERSTKL